MRNGDAMTKPVDLDALDALYNAPRRRCLLSGSDIDYQDWVRLNNNQDNAEREILDAYPAMAAELRERRAREEEMAAELRALREVAEAAKAFLPTCERVMRLNGVCVGCRELATHEGRKGSRLCDAHAGAHRQPLSKMESVAHDALRAALAKVPR